jgi:hypothetical protein
MMKDWIASHWKSLSPRMVALGVAALAYAGTMNIPVAQKWISSNLGQHPKLVSFASSLMFIVALYQKPYVHDAVDNALRVKQVSPDKVVITQEPKEPQQ